MQINLHDQHSQNHHLHLLQSLRNEMVDEEQDKLVYNHQHRCLFQLMLIVQKVILLHHLNFLNDQQTRQLLLKNVR
jgi:hypothetical protein